MAMAPHSSRCARTWTRGTSPLGSKSSGAAWRVVSGGPDGCVLCPLCVGFKGKPKGKRKPFWGVVPFRGWLKPKEKLSIFGGVWFLFLLETPCWVN